MKTDRRLDTLRHLVLGWLCLVPTMAWSAEALPADTTVQLGLGVSVNTSKREVYLDTTICLRRGILEYLICKTRTFEHESVFASDCKPSLLHAALLLVGAEALPDADTFTWAEKLHAYAPSLIAIEVEYERDGVRQRKPISSFVINREQPDGIVPDRWVFAGSVFYQRDGQELYAADSTGGVIGLTPKGASVVQFGERLGVPYQGESLGLECNQDVIPPLGTAVRVILSPVSPRAPRLPAEITPAPAHPVASDGNPQTPAKP
jgi:hypothetical protein